MRWSVIGGSVALAMSIAQGAVADGMPIRPSPVALSPSPWLGVYAGINGGYGASLNDQNVHFDESAGIVPVFSGNFGTLDLRGGFAGGQLGANFAQLGPIILGVEADAQWSEIDDDASRTIPYLGGGTTISARKKNEVTAFGTFRPRIGFAFDRTLVYATGGLAWGKIEHTFATTDSLGFRTLDRSRRSSTGYALGGGLEHLFSPRLSLKAEYQYIDLGSESYSANEVFGPAAVPTVFSMRTETDTDFHTLRIGLNYQLTGGVEAGPLK